MSAYSSILFRDDSRRGVQHVFIVGSKGIPGNYGGYETFVDRLTERHQFEDGLKYHVACKADNNDIHEVNGARCFNVKVPNIGPAQAVLYDLIALCRVIKYIQNEQINNPIVYILACRIGPFCKYFHKRLLDLGGKLLVNPDGHEWKRAKWNRAIRAYWKYSERLMVENCNLLICDSKNIEQYIHDEYDRSDWLPSTTYISYGADCIDQEFNLDDTRLLSWYRENGLSRNDYYLVVGRFVPENNYEVMIREFMQSETQRSFAIITNVSPSFLEELKERTGFNHDLRIKFVGTVYDQALLKMIRKNAFAYLHGHEVGGTNPSLLESLGTTDLNLLLDVGFNREVAEDSALYWSKEPGCLAKLIDRVDELGQKDIERLGKRAKERICKCYSWEFISTEYLNLFLGAKK